MSIGTSDGETFNDRWDYVMSRLSGFVPFKEGTERLRDLNEQHIPGNITGTKTITPGSPALEHGIGPGYKTFARYAQFGPGDKDTSRNYPIISDEDLKAYGNDPVPEGSPYYKNIIPNAGDLDFDRKNIPKAVEGTGAMIDKNHPLLKELEDSGQYEIFRFDPKKHPGFEPQWNLIRRKDQWKGVGLAGQRFAQNQTGTMSDAPVTLKDDSKLTPGAPSLITRPMPAERQAAERIAKIPREPDIGPGGTSAMFVDNTHDVPYGAGASNEGNLVHIDRHIPRSDPRLKTADGQPADLYKYLSIHELQEKKAMEGGMPYEKAHLHVATPAERDAVEADGINWSEYEKVMDGYLSHIEHENPKNPPDNLYLKPYPHKEQAIIKGHIASGEQVPEDHSRQMGMPSDHLINPNSPLMHNFMQQSPPAEWQQKIRDWLVDHPLVDILTKSVGQAIATGGTPTRGPSGPIARPYIGVNQLGHTFPLNERGRTATTFPSVPLRPKEPSEAFTTSKHPEGLYRQRSPYTTSTGAPSETFEAVGEAVNQEVGDLNQESRIEATRNAQTAIDETLGPQRRGTGRDIFEQEPFEHAMPTDFDPRAIEPGRTTGGGYRVSDIKAKDIKLANIDSTSNGKWHSFDVLNEEGKKIATGSMSFDSTGTQAHVSHLADLDGKSWGIGTKNMIQMARQAKALFPEMEHIGAVRISGVRHGPASEIGSRYKPFSMNTKNMRPAPGIEPHPDRIGKYWSNQPPDTSNINWRDLPAE